MSSKALGFKFAVGARVTLASRKKGSPSLASKLAELRVTAEAKGHPDLFPDGKGAAPQVMKIINRVLVENAKGIQRRYRCRPIAPKGRDSKLSAIGSSVDLDFLEAELVAAK